MTTNFRLPIVFSNLFLLVLLGQLTWSCSSSKQAHINNPALYFSDKVRLGNYPQAVIVRGTKTDNPFLIHLHGGPGYPLFPFLETMRGLEQEFNLVYWEQRGTARSFSKELNPNSMQTDSLLRDLDELVQWVKQKFGVQKVFIWGHSWGTNLGMLYAAKHPENLWAYMGTGQSVNLYQNERLCYAFALNKAKEFNDKTAIGQILKVDTSQYALSDALLVRKWIYTYGGIVHANRQKRNYLNWHLLTKVLHTPAYSFQDKMHLIVHRTFSGETLWDDMMHIDLEHQAPVIDVPVYFFEGRYDHLVSSQLAHSYFEKLIAPKGKHWIWFENSAHRPQTEEPEKFMEQMKNAKSESYIP